MHGYTVNFDVCEIDSKNEFEWLKTSNLVSGENILVWEPVENIDNVKMLSTFCLQDL